MQLIHNSLEYWKQLPELLKNIYELSDKTELKQGCLRSNNFQHTDNMPKAYRDQFDYLYKKYECYDAQIFTTMSSTEGMGWHIDPDNVIIQCLFGKAEYRLGTNNSPIITLQEGETLYIPKGKPHIGLGHRYPRIILSLGTPKTSQEVDADYDYEKTVGDTV